MITFGSNLEQELKTVRALAARRVTLELVRHGVSEDMLVRLQLKVDEGEPYAMSPLRGWDVLLPLDAGLLRLVRIYCTLKWLQNDPPSSRNRSDAYDAVALYEAEPDLNAGRHHRNAQKARAKLPRDILNEEGTTMRRILAKLVRAHPDEQAIEIWPHFISELRTCDLEPDEKTTGVKKDEKHVQYRNRSEAGKPRTLTLRSFSALLRNARKQASRKASA